MVYVLDHFFPSRNYKRRIEERREGREGWRNGAKLVLNKEQLIKKERKGVKERGSKCR